MDYGQLDLKTKLEIGNKPKKERQKSINRPLNGNI